MNDFMAFGEILFDCFEDGRSVLGGAPLNVTYHMSRLGMDSSIISALGRDVLGLRALEEMKSLDVDTSRVAVLDDRPTGRADITLCDGDADYTFNSPAAWDDIPLPQALPSHVGCMYFGSLAQRSAVSRSSLMRLLETVDADMVFYDVNIRKDFYSRDILGWSLARADVLKVNGDELPLICSTLETDEESLMKEYGLEMMIVTQGAQGSTLYLQDGTRHHQSPSPCNVVDSVGAGDSLCAGFIATMLRTGDPVRALEVGTMIADYVITRRGATPGYDEGLIGRLESIGAL